MTGKIFAGLLASALCLQPAFAEGSGTPKRDPNARGTAATDSGAADLNSEPSEKQEAADRAGTGSTSSSDDAKTPAQRKKAKKHGKGGMKKGDTSETQGGASGSGT